MSKGKIANALSDFRLILSAVVALYIAFTPPSLWWGVAIGLVAVAALTDPIDGRIARSGTPAPDGKKRNERATGALSILLPGGLLVHHVIGRFWFDWPGSPTQRLLIWAVVCVIFGLATIFVFNRAREVLIPEKAERFEVWQAWFTAVIVITCAFEMYLLAWIGETGQKPSFGYLVLFVVGFILLLELARYLSGDRFLERRQEREAGLYKGTKYHLYRRG